VENIDPALVALALSTGYLVNVLTDVCKGIAGRSRRRRWLLPLAGIVIGIVLVALLQVYREQDLTPKTVAGTLLAGVVAFGLAALSNDQSRRAEGDGRG
jgi:chromate transport protein ChrA